MPHITLPEELPGILGPLALFPETGKPLRALTEAILRGPSTLTPEERELIAAYVSRLNDCRFCAGSHAAASRHLYGSERQTIVDQVLNDVDSADLSEKMKALLKIAGKVQQSGRNVSKEDVERARLEGADDKAIHDTVLTAAAFCMLNRYVDGLATSAPEEDAVYSQIGADLATRGYANSRS